MVESAASLDLPQSQAIRAGVGNWDAFPHERLDLVWQAADDWKRALAGVTRPWLCWCVDDEWCLVQQRLVRACGWTPIVGTDGRVPRPTLLPEALFLDFNARLRLPLMYMHFPLEFVFRFADILAFWHSDLLPPLSVLRPVAEMFTAIAPGEYLGVREQAGRVDVLKAVWRAIRQRNLANLRNVWERRWFEVIGCTTAEASRQQFECGCGIWKHVERHPHAPRQLRGRPPYYDHGVGVWCWERFFSGQARELPVDVRPFHYVTVGSQRARNAQGVREKSRDLANYSLPSIVARLGLQDRPP